MPFYMNHQSGRVDLEDMPLDVWIEIEAATGMKWHEVLSANLIGDSKVASIVVAAAAKFADVPAPTLTLRSLGKVLTWEDGENIPVQYEDGIPDPKATDTGAATT